MFVLILCILLIVFTLFLCCWYITLAILHTFLKKSDFVLGLTFTISAVLTFVILNRWNYFLESNLVFIAGILCGISFTYLKMRKRIQIANTSVHSFKIFGWLILGGVFGFLILLAIIGWTGWIAANAIRMA